jgi:hypothetical protein
MLPALDRNRRSGPTAGAAQSDPHMPRTGRQMGPELASTVRPGSPCVGMGNERVSLGQFLAPDRLFRATSGHPLRSPDSMSPPQPGENAGDALSGAGQRMIGAALYCSTAAIPNGSRNGRSLRTRRNLSDTEEGNGHASNPEYALLVPTLARCVEPGPERRHLLEGALGY